MSVKHAILTLLCSKPRHGYEIKTGFDELVQKTWPLNPGQVYTTLDRLERDGLIESPGQDEKDRKLYSITDKGHKEVYEWLDHPVERSLLKDEFYFKWLCARRMEKELESRLIDQQKVLIVKEILHLTKFKQQLKQMGQEDMELLIEGALLHLEADMKWLELIGGKK